MECYTYALDREMWKKTVTFLHEQAPEPVSGKTTRKNIFYDRVGNIVERNQEAFIDGAWHLVDRTVYEYDIEGHVVKETDFAGRETVSVWGDGCCGKSSETLPDGTVHTYAYDGTGRVVRKTKRAAGEATVVYTRDPLGRVVRLEQTGLNQRTYAYDALGRTVRAVDALGGETRTAYSADGNTVTNVYADLSTEVRRTDAAGRRAGLGGSEPRGVPVCVPPLFFGVSDGGAASADPGDEAAHEDRGGEAQSAGLHRLSGGRTVRQMCRGLSDGRHYAAQEQRRAEIKRGAVHRLRGLSAGLPGVAGEGDDGAPHRTSGDAGEPKWMISGISGSRSST